ncbi:unnamed protein product, partial [Linum tenue]
SLFILFLIVSCLVGNSTESKTTLLDIKQGDHDIPCNTPKNCSTFCGAKYHCVETVCVDVDCYCVQQGTDSVTLC